MLLSIGVFTRKVFFFLIQTCRGEFILPVVLKTVYVSSFLIHRGGYFCSQSIRSRNRLRKCYSVMLWATVLTLCKYLAHCSYEWLMTLIEYMTTVCCPSSLSIISQSNVIKDAVSIQTKTSSCTELVTSTNRRSTAVIVVHCPSTLPLIPLSYLTESLCCASALEQPIWSHLEQAPVFRWSDE